MRTIALPLLLLSACGGARSEPAAPPAPPDAAAAPVAESPSSCPPPPADRSVVSGVVTDERSGGGVAGVIVRVESDRVKTTPQGIFYFCDVAPGAHTIGFAYGGVEVERPLQATAGQESTIDLKLQTAGTGAPVKMQ